LSSGEDNQLFFKLCSDHLSFEAIPKSALKIDLLKLRDHTLRGHELVMWTPQFVILRNLQGQEITLRTDGRMVIRKVTAESSARKAASEIMNLVTRASPR
jgi:hypothetical protein